MTKIYFSKNVFTKYAWKPFSFFFHCKMLGWVDDYMSWNDIVICHFAVTYRHSSWFPNTWKLRRRIAPQTSIPSGCVHSKGASLFGHCGPGRQGRHLVSTEPPPSLPGGWSLPDEEVSGVLRGRDTQTSAFRLKTTKVCILFNEIASTLRILSSTCICETVLLHTYSFNCNLNWVSE